MNKIVISIILPVFNSEKTIAKAINSIVCQECEKIELIIIDDGSDDHTIDIIEEYERKYKFVKVIKSSHRGVSYSRNIGIMKSSGDFIMFMDSDDFFVEDSLKCYLEKIYEYTDIDVFVSNYYRQINNHEYPVIEKGLNCKNLNDFLATGKEKMKENYIESNCIMGSVWRCAFKKNFLSCNNILFDEKLRLNEDLVFLMETINKGNVMHIEDYTYVYVFNKNSVVNESYKINLLENRFRCIEYYKKFYIKKAISAKSFYRWNYKFAYEVFRNEMKKKSMKHLKNIIESKKFKTLNNFKAILYSISDGRYKEFIVLMFCLLI